MIRVTSSYFVVVVFLFFFCFFLWHEKRLKLNLYPEKKKDINFIKQSEQIIKTN